jgi:hypothetical protein
MTQTSTQPELPFELEPAISNRHAIARNTDPGTSHAAAVAVTESGRRMPLAWGEWLNDRSFRSAWI